MQPITNSIFTNSQSLLGLLTAILAAAVAIAVVLLTQWAVGKRSRQELLTKKLEELFLLAIQAKSELFIRQNLMLQYLGSKGSSLFLGGNVDEERLKNTRFEDTRYVTMQMYVRLYFPKLRPAFNAHFHVYREVVSTFSRMRDKTQTVPATEINELMESYTKTYQAFEYEILENRQVLTNDHIFPLQFRKKSIDSTKTKAHTSVSVGDKPTSPT